MDESKTFDKYLTPGEEKKLLAALDKARGVIARRDEGWIVLMRQTGIRVYACSQISVGDGLDALETGELYLRGAIQKRGQAHTVWVNKKAQAAIRSLLRVRRRMGLSAIDREEPLIPSREGGTMSSRSFQLRIKFWGARAGLSKDITPHWLRHTLAKRLMSTTVAANPLPIVQRVLGHRSLRSTSVYLVPDKETVKAAMQEAS